MITKMTVTPTYAQSVEYNKYANKNYNEQMKKVCDWTATFGAFYCKCSILFDSLIETPEQDIIAAFKFTFGEDANVTVKNYTKKRRTYSYLTCYVSVDDDETI